MAVRLYDKISNIGGLAFAYMPKAVIWVDTNQFISPSRVYVWTKFVYMPN
jgi:hypothetical protein